MNATTSPEAVSATAAVVAAGPLGLSAFPVCTPGRARTQPPYFSLIEAFLAEFRRRWRHVPRRFVEDGWQRVTEEAPGGASYHRPAEGPTPKGEIRCQQQP
jgi:hypothetical protein